MLFSKRLLVFYATLVCTNAAVIGIEKQEERLDDRVMRRDTTTISQDLLTKFQLFANYTAASYCPGNENQTAGTPITCPDGECGIAEADSPIAVVEFGVDNTTTALKGYLATSAPTSLIVLAFAGSGNTVRNWITDFEILEVATDLCSSCSIHTGFNTAWTERRSLILEALTATTSLYPDFEIVVTGHSIGAAVATLAAAEIRATMNLSVDLYTFGSPRVGNQAFAEFVTDQAPGLGGNYRVTHVNDPVPQIPPTWVGYQHVSPEYWLSTGNDTTDVYTVDDVVVCEGVGNTGCNAGTGLVPIDGTAHNHYLGDVSACQAGVEFRR